MWENKFTINIRSKKGFVFKNWLFMLHFLQKMLTFVPIGHLIE